jgi:hypothetical protein
MALNDYFLIPIMVQQYVLNLYAWVIVRYEGHVPTVYICLIDKKVVL